MYKSFNEYINPKIYLGFRTEGHNPPAGGSVDKKKS